MIRFLPVLLLGCIPNGTVKLAYECTPLETGDGWAISTPEAEGLEAGAVESLCRELFREDAHLNVQTLHVVANGALVAEAAFRDPADLDRLQQVQSVSKSITSLVVGTAIDRGLVPGVDTRLDTWLESSFPEGEPDKHAITLEDLLTMRSGIDVSNARFGIQVLMKGKEDSVAWILEQPLYAPPGEQMDYRDADPHLVAAAIEAATGERFDDYTRQALFEPLGIEDAHVESAPDGRAIAAAGVWIRPRDLARIGQLALDRGVWEGERVVSEAWIEQAIQARTHTSLDSPIDAYGYGYYWWVLPDGAGFTADGHGGQYVTVFPDDGVVVVLTASPYAASEVGTPLWEWEPLVRPLVGQ